MRVLITGGAGFVGHHVCEHFLVNTDWELVLLDRLDFSGNLNRLAESEIIQKHAKRCRFLFHDLRAPINETLKAQIGPIYQVVHCAASTHVDRSITDPVSFVYDNVLGTAHILEFARHASRELMYLSTDEIFGVAPHGVAYKEGDPYNSRNPYSATKAGAEEFCVAYANTYGLPVTIIHCMNMFGERQSVEKFIPMCIKRIRGDEEILIHGDKKGVPGSRMYLHARNLADAMLFLIDRGKYGKYNVVGDEISNLDLVFMIADIMGKGPWTRHVDFHSARPGHDLRYALDGSKLAALGWRPPVDLCKSLEKTVEWTLAHPEWLA